MLVLEYQKFGYLAGIDPLFLAAFLKNRKKWLNLLGENGVIFALTVAHVPDVLLQNPSGLEFY